MRRVAKNADLKHFTDTFIQSIEAMGDYGCNFVQNELITGIKILKLYLSLLGFLVWKIIHQVGDIQVTEADYYDAIRLWVSC